MKHKKYTKLSTVSEATLRPEDLIPAFCDELRALGMRSKRLTRIEKAYENAITGKDSEYFTCQAAENDVATLMDMLQSYAPPYCYFGSHPGDGADFGFWIDDFITDDFDGLRVSDLSELDNHKGYIGDVLHVNDHGNMTLYYKSARKLTEIWSIV